MIENIDSLPEIKFDEGSWPGFSSQDRGPGTKTLLVAPKNKTVGQVKGSTQTLCDHNKAEIRDCNIDDLCCTLKVEEVYTNSIAVVLFFHTSMYIVGSGLVVSFLSKLGDSVMAQLLYHFRKVFLVI